MSSHACGGECCRDFTVSMDPKKLGDLYVVTKARQAAGEDLTNFERDAIYIAEMVVRIDEDDETRARYTCKHLDTTTGRCRSYDQRPAMCRDYPNYGCAVACTFCGFSEPLPPSSLESCPGQQSSAP